MCRLFGSITAEPVNIVFSFFEAPNPFKSFLHKNKDGWGIGWYDEQGDAQVFKEGLNEVQSLDNYHFMKVRRVVSKIIMSHVRDASVGDNRRENAHPFRYKNWLFIQNGRSDRAKTKVKLKKKYAEQLKGSTDSEVYFMLIMQYVEEGNPVPKAVKKALEIVKPGATGMNFLLSDGKDLYAYRDFNEKGDVFTLYYLVRKVRGKKRKKIEYRSGKTEQLLQSQHIHKEKTVLLCSEKLTNEKWKTIEKGELVRVNKDLELKVNRIS